MKPFKKNGLKTSKIYNLNTTVLPGEFKTLASVKGIALKLGDIYKLSNIVIYLKDNLLPILATRPDSHGAYEFLGLSTSINCFIVAFDEKKQYNAVIQDNVVPK